LLPPFGAPAASGQKTGSARPEEQGDMLARPRSRWFGCCIRPNRGALDEVAAAGFDIANRLSGLAARHPA